VGCSLIGIFSSCLPPELSEPFDVKVPSMLFCHRRPAATRTAARIKRGSPKVFSNYANPSLPIPPPWPKDSAQSVQIDVSRIQEG